LSKIIYTEGRILFDMPRYMVLYQAVPENWPKDPKEIQSMWEGIIAGTDQMLKAGITKEGGLFTNFEGYAIFQAESMDKVIGYVSPFFPYWTETIREIGEWDKSKESLLGSLRQAASMAQR